MLGKLHIHSKKRKKKRKKEIERYLTPLTKIHLNRLKSKHKTPNCKYPKRKQRGKLLDINLSDHFWI